MYFAGLKDLVVRQRFGMAAHKIYLWHNFCVCLRKWCRWLNLEVGILVQIIICLARLSAEIQPDAIYSGISVKLNTCDTHTRRERRPCESNEASSRASLKSLACEWTWYSALCFQSSRCRTRQNRCDKLAELFLKFSTLNLFQITQRECIP